MPSLVFAPTPRGPLTSVAILDAAAHPLAREDFLHALASDPQARAAFDEHLGSAPYRALFLELPPLAPGRLRAAAELVLVDAPGLLRMRPEPEAFAKHLRGPGPSVRSFDNLGRNARLLAPCERGSLEAYVHLAAFCRHAPVEQRDLLWRMMAEHALVHVAHRTEPVWVSTSGLGVGWLHVRLDSRPKYYSHHPYRDPSA